MSNRGKFEIEYDNLPLIFEVQFGNQNVSIGINYNELGDFYTADLYNAAFEPIILGEKLVYGKRLWRNSVSREVPVIDIVPLDESGGENTISKSNFGKTVFLYQDSSIPGGEDGSKETI